MTEKLIKHSKKDYYAYSMRTSDGYNFDSHIHRCYEFLYVMEGHFLYTVEGNEYMLSPGDMLFTSPNELHSFSFPEKCTYRRQFFHVYPIFIEDVISLLPDINSRTPGTCNYIPPALVTKYKLYEIFSGLEEYCEHPIKETDSMVLTYAMQMITKISQILRSEAVSVSKAPVNKNVHKITDYIENHFTEHIDLEHIANDMYMDKSYLGRLFRKQTGMTIKVYLNMRRIVLAKNLILSGMQATDIYMDCGFENYSTFYRAFKKYVGFSPEDFKRLH